MAGMAMAFWREGSRRVAVSFIGEGGSSLGEWHEAINLCAARRLPAIFCVAEQPDRAVDAGRAISRRSRVFADKAAGYGMPGITIDGTDPDAIAAAFAWAAERARAGLGPTLIETRRDAHVRPRASRRHAVSRHAIRSRRGTIPPLTEQGYANRELYAYWAARDPIALYAARWRPRASSRPAISIAFKREAEAMVEAEARAVIDAPWPEPAQAGVGVFANEAPRVHVEVLDPERCRLRAGHACVDRCDSAARRCRLSSRRRRSIRRAARSSKRVMLGVGDALRADPRVFVYGEDVGGQYGNAFLLLRPLLKEFGDRIINSPLAEGAVLGVCVGAALAGQRPIGEMQFNDFVATGFNQLVNNAAKIRYRWGGDVPMVVRMPWGGLRHAGPYHSQNTEAWFYRTPGLKIVVPSTPHDARALMASAVADPDPVLYYEHIALYRDPRIKQLLDDGAAGADPARPGGAAPRRRRPRDHLVRRLRARRACASRRSWRADGIEASVLDLRTLVPLDRGGAARAWRATATRC